MSEIRGRGGEGGAQHHVLVSSHPVKWSRNMSEIRGRGEGGTAPCACEQSSCRVE